MDETSTKILLLVTKNEERYGELAETIALRGVRVFWCHEREAAAAILAHTPVDAVLTQIQLTPFNGYDGLLLLRHVSSHFPKIAAICWVTHFSSELRNYAHLFQNVSFLCDPIQFKEIESHLPCIFQGADQPSKGHVLHVNPLEDFLSPQVLSTLMQPIFSLDLYKRDIVGTEVLTRLKGKKHHFSPEILFTYAAKKEQIHKIDFFCIKNLLTEVKQVGFLGHLFVNVRPRSFIYGNFCSQLITLIAQSGFTADQIVLELTEQQTLLNVKDFRTTLYELKREGFKIALDDFGVGFANLQMLYELKPDFIKLSGVFSRDLENDFYKQVIIKANAKMAHSLGCKTILENVESQATAEKAKELGVDYAQGYHFCRPLSPEAFSSGEGWEREQSVREQAKVL